MYTACRENFFFLSLSKPWNYDDRKSSIGHVDIHIDVVLGSNCLLSNDFFLVCVPRMGNTSWSNDNCLLAAKHTRNRSLRIYGTVRAQREPGPVQNREVLPRVPSCMNYKLEHGWPIGPIGPPRSNRCTCSTSNAGATCPYCLDVGLEKSAFVSLSNDDNGSRLRHRQLEMTKKKKKTLVSGPKMKYSTRKNSIWRTDLRHQ